MTIPLLLERVIESKIGDNIPRLWMTMINDKIDALYTKNFWDAVCEAPDYKMAMLQHRYFPISKGPTSESKELYLKITKDVLNANEVSMTDIGADSKPANYKRLESNVLSNFSTIAPYMGEPDMKELHIIAQICRETNQLDVLAKLCYYICINYTMCHLIYKDAFVIDLIDQCLRMPDFTGLIYTGIKYANYILNHEERVMADQRDHEFYIRTRSVISISQLARVSWLNQLRNVEPNLNPLLTTCNENASILDKTFMYVSGERSIPSISEIRKRIDIQGLFRGFERYNVKDGAYHQYIALTGGHLSMVACDNPTGDQKVRCELYYGTGDYDVAVWEPSFPLFIQFVKFVLKPHLDRNLVEAKLEGEGKIENIMTGTGVRFRYHHPALKKPIEIFKAQTSLLKLVARFHLPCVRAVYDFIDIYMTHSFMVSMMTGICESYDWFMNYKNPMHIPFKYAQRGFATILNTKEFEAIAKMFAMPNQEWNYPALTNPTTLVGKHDITEEFYRVDTHPNGLRYGQSVLPQFVTEQSSSSTTVAFQYRGQQIKFWRNKGGQWYLAQPQKL